MRFSSKVVTPVVAVGASIIVTTLILWAMGEPPGAFGRAFVAGSFGSLSNFSEMLVKATPLLVAALGVSVAFKAGLFNIGVEGQIYAGGLATAYVAAAWHLPLGLHALAAIGAGALVGGMLTLIPAWLKVSRGVNEVITTLMVYYVASLAVHYMVVNPLRAPGVVPATRPIAGTAVLPVLVRGTRLHLGVVIAVVLAVLLWFLIYRTVFGFHLRSVGENRTAAAYSGIPVSRVVYLAMFLSGAVAGVAGAIQVLGVDHRFFDQFSPGLGFDSIAVALVGMAHPLGTILAGFLFGALRTGVLEMTVRFGTPKALALVVEGLTVLFLAFERLYRVRLLREGRVS
ncbi:MAG: ABC transporter permease [Betaproteobacteria bacterium]